MKNVLLLLTGFFGLVLTGCDSNDLFQSEKKMESKIQKSWLYVYPNLTDTRKEIWSFANGSVAVTFKLNANTDTTIVGTYSVDTKVSKAYVHLSGFTYSGYTNSGFLSEDLNRKWTVSELSGDVMYLSATDSKGSIRSLEFIDF